MYGGLPARGEERSKSPPSPGVVRAGGMRGSTRPSTAGGNYQAFLMGTVSGTVTTIASGPGSGSSSQAGTRPTSAAMTAGQYRRVDPRRKVSPREQLPAMDHPVGGHLPEILWGGGVFPHVVCGEGFLSYVDVVDIGRMLSYQHGFGPPTDLSPYNRPKLLQLHS